MKKKLLLFAMAVMLLMSSVAMADAPPYSWVQGGWHGLFGEPGDLVAELGYISWSLDFEDIDDQSGLFGRIGIR